MCEYCEENEKRKLLNITCKFSYENPLAYGYPEIVYWNEEISLDYCPMCGRKLGKEK